MWSPTRGGDLARVDCENPVEGDCLIDAPIESKFLRLANLPQSPFGIESEL